MDVKQYIQGQFAGMRRQTDEAIKDTTDEQFNWTPPGTVNPISATFLHMIAGEDFFIQAILRGQPRLWESEGWSERIGIAAPPSPGRGWDEIRGRMVPLAPVLAYQEAVHAATDAYLAKLTAEELDRQVSFVGGERPAGDMLALLVVHTASHAGEIAAVKGMQGVKGLPF